MEYGVEPHCANGACTGAIDHFPVSLGRPTIDNYNHNITDNRLAIKGSSVNFTLTEGFLKIC